MSLLVGVEINISKVAPAGTCSSLVELHSVLRDFANDTKLVSFTEF